MGRLRSTASIVPSLPRRIALRAASNGAGQAVLRAVRNGATEPAEIAGKTGLQSTSDSTVTPGPRARTITGHPAPAVTRRVTPPSSAERSGP